MTNFKQYYREQEMLQEFNGSGVDYIAKQAGKATSFVSGIAGKAIKGVLKMINPFDFFIKNAKRVYDQIKNKIDNLVALAEKVYPYDKIIYAAMKKDKQGFSDYMSQWISTKALEKSTSIDNNSFHVDKYYSPGFDICVRVFGAVLGNAEKNQDVYGTKTKITVSFKTLDDAYQFSKVRIPKMNGPKEALEYFEGNALKDASQLGHWIKTATLFCSWKNRLEGGDVEGADSLIVDTVLKEMNGHSLDEINTKFLELLSKGIEPNAENIKNSMGVSNEDFFGYVKEKFDNGTSIIGKVSIKFDESDTANFLTAYKNTQGQNPGRNYELVADEYITFKYLMQKTRSTQSIGNLITKDHSNFMNMFRGNLRDKNMISLYEKINTKPDIRKTVWDNYLKLFSDGVEVNGRLVKMNKQLIDNIDELFKVITSNAINQNTTNQTQVK